MSRIYRRAWEPFNQACRDAEVAVRAFVAARNAEADAEVRSTIASQRRRRR